MLQYPLKLPPCIDLHYSWRFPFKNQWILSCRYIWVIRNRPTIDHHIEPPEPHILTSISRGGVSCYSSVLSLIISQDTIWPVSFIAAGSSMPVPSIESDSAMQQVMHTFDLPPSSDLDLIFLKGIMESPMAHERMEETRLEAVRENNLQLVQEILQDMAGVRDQSGAAAELQKILQEPHFQSLLQTHDSVASKNYETPPASPLLDPTLSNQPVPPDAVRMVGVRKNAGEHLGVTFRVEGGELVIARILHGGVIDQQGLLHVGDVIREVNGREVGSDPQALQELLREASGSVVLKILPSYQEQHPLRQVFVKCHFSYEPSNDSLIPCKEAGLAFRAGDLLQIVNQEDPNWWQACLVKGGSAGLIPSQLLEEKRKAFVKRDGALCGSMGGKKKKRIMYVTTKNAEFDRHELLIYEEVAKMPPFRRKTLILIGAQGVGRRSLKNKLLTSDSLRYGTTTPYTSRKRKDGEWDGQSYSFVSRTEMEHDIKAGRYLEHGEYEGNLYGTKISSIQEVVASGKMCVLDVNPQAVKVLRTAEFVPYVVFIGAPDFDTLKSNNLSAVEAGMTAKQLSDGELLRIIEESERLQQAYGHYFDLSLVNSDLDETFQELQTALEKLRTEPQWVPVSWVY
ncbi:MAGUK p55 subfamily member 2 isoform X2 [Hyla sarda]|uniref:MAGUK p55 subfamily member 2 isoform X2 n=1 Tax=Hyla sarda TaxID=327740 RepID=UPI0024C2A01F|nr:MAGUK p55 subfamily member 2 isoform X2 [Hyla sarda]